MTLDYNEDDEILTTELTDKKKLKELEKENIQLKNKIKTQDKMIKDYEKVITDSSITKLNDTDNGLTDDDLFNIMNNQSVLIMK